MPEEKDPLELLIINEALKQQPEKQSNLDILLEAISEQSIIISRLSAEVQKLSRYVEGWKP